MAGIKGEERREGKEREGSEPPKFRFHDFVSPRGGYFLRAPSFGPREARAKVRCTYVQPGQGRIRGAPVVGWVIRAESCMQRRARARARVHRTRWPLQLRGARGSANRAQPRASSASLGCIPRASTRETALERSAECNAQCRANTRRRDANSCARTLFFTATITRIFARFAILLSSFSFFLSFFF